jgi:hypothetical protein
VVHFCSVNDAFGSFRNVGSEPLSFHSNIQRKRQLQTFEYEDCEYIGMKEAQKNQLMNCDGSLAIST